MSVKPLPPTNSFDDIKIWKSLNLASRSLAELKGESKTIPNIDILINTLSLQESKESSEIENIVTTQDDLFKSQVEENTKSIAAKEVKQYPAALLHGFNLVKHTKTYSAGSDPQLVEADIFKIIVPLDIRLTQGDFVQANH